MRAESRQLQLLFEGGSFDALRQAVPGAALRAGSPFIVQMGLKMPVAKAFDLAGAETLFRRVTPPGMDLVDVHSDGWSTVIVNMRVRAEAAQAPEGSARMAALPAVAAVVAFLAANWKILALLTIGLALTLGFLATSIRGFGEVTRVLERSILLVAVAAAAVIGITLIQRERSGET